MMHSLTFGDTEIYYFDEEDLAPCRACGVQPIYKKGAGNSGDYVRCPKCGVKTGTCTSGLGGLVPVWNRIMLDGWEDPR